MDAGLVWRGKRGHIPGAGPFALRRPGVTMNERTDGVWPPRLVILGEDGAVAEDLGVIEPRATNVDLGFNYAAGDDVVVTAIHMTSEFLDTSVFDIYWWNRQSKQLKRIASNPTDKDGVPYQSSWVRPVIAGNSIYWTEGAAPYKGWIGSRLMRYSMLDGSTTEIYAGVVFAVASFGDLVIYTALPASAPTATDSELNSGNGAPLETMAINAATGTPAEVPVGLDLTFDGPQGGWYFSSNDDAIVWTGSGKQVLSWRPGWKEPLSVLPAHNEDGIGKQLGFTGYSHIDLVGDLLFFRNVFPYVLDLRTGAIARLQSPGLPYQDVGYEWAHGTLVAVANQTQPSRQVRDRGEVDVLTDLTVFDVATLPPLPPCR